MTAPLISIRDAITNSGVVVGVVFSVFDGGVMVATECGGVSAKGVGLTAGMRVRIANGIATPIPAPVMEFRV